VAFLDAAEDSGLMVPLGRFMLEQACTDVARWRRDHEEAASMTVHVNLSGRQLEHPDVCSDVESALAASGLPPDALVLEVTESVFVAEISGATARLAELKSLGVRLGLDDFGTGYSSLSFLASVPFDVLKIDKSFVDRLADGSSPVIEAVATLAAALGLELVAEGVEHQAQVGRLVGLGCRLAQGFYFSRPVDHVAIEAMVSSGGVPGRCMTG
jgi:EAL domain-containing protein (putative c-di-GMP-specific phosphodiesterase class I)